MAGIKIWGKNGEPLKTQGFVAVQENGSKLYSCLFTMSIRETAYMLRASQVPEQFDTGLCTILPSIEVDSRVAHPELSYHIGVPLRWLDLPLVFRYSILIDYSSKYGEYVSSNYYNTQESIDVYEGKFYLETVQRTPQRSALDGELSIEYKHGLYRVYGGKRLAYWIDTNKPMMTKEKFIPLNDRGNADVPSESEAIIE